MCYFLKEISEYIKLLLFAVDRLFVSRNITEQIFCYLKFMLVASDSDAT